MNSIGTYAKAIIGALVAGLASLQQALDDSSVSAQEWTGVAIATLSGLALVWAIPNKGDGEGGEAGEANTLLLLVVAALILAVLAIFGVRLGD